MSYPYDLHSWSTQYREERLTEATRYRLVERARTRRDPREAGQSRLAWRKPLALLRDA